MTDLSSSKPQPVFSHHSCNQVNGSDDHYRRGNWNIKYSAQWGASKQRRTSEVTSVIAMIPTSSLRLSLGDRRVQHHRMQAVQAAEQKQPLLNCAIRQVQFSGVVMSYLYVPAALPGAAIGCTKTGQYDRSVKEISF